MPNESSNSNENGSDCPQAHHDVWTSWTRHPIHALVQRQGSENCNGSKYYCSFLCRLKWILDLCSTFTFFCHYKLLANLVFAKPAQFLISHCRRAHKRGEGGGRSADEKFSLYWNMHIWKWKFKNLWPPASKGMRSSCVCNVCKVLVKNIPQGSDQPSQPNYNIVRFQQLP